MILNSEKGSDPLIIRDKPVSVADPNTDYYHINRGVLWSPYAILNADDQFDVGGNSNPYFKFFETQKKAYPVTQSDGSQLMVSGVRFVGAVAKGEVNSPNIAGIAYDLAKHLVAYVRELVWEDLRKKEFPHLQETLRGQSEAYWK